MKGSMVASKLGMLMWSTDMIHPDKLADRLSTMGQRRHENPVLAAKGHMQYKWFKSKLKEQTVIKNQHIKAQCKYCSGGWNNL